MASLVPLNPPPKPPDLHDTAIDNLRFIRETRERATSFTAVSGWGQVVPFCPGRMSPIPGMWLMLFGTGIATGGALSVKIVPLMGLCFMVLGAGVLFAPARWANWFMAAGFGGLIIVLGVLIARRHGG